MGALRRLDARVASLPVRHTIAEARASGFRRLSLETGSSRYLRLAIARYRSQGFRACPAFVDCRPDSNSMLITLALAPCAGRLPCLE
jgi:putative acetyltransferase